MRDAAIRAGRVGVGRRRTLLGVLVAFFVALVAMVGLAGKAYATPGSLDKTFDGDGSVFTNSESQRTAEDHAVQPDGKIVVAGSGIIGRTQRCSVPESGFSLARYNSDGSLDSSFDNDGKLTTSVGSGKNTQVSCDGNNNPVVQRLAGAEEVAVQPDGKIVTAGWAFDGGERSHFAVVRYNPDGSLDTGFGNGGVAVILKDLQAGGAPDYSEYRAGGLSLQPDGKIVVAGTSYNSTDKYRLTLVRLNGDGGYEGGTLMDKGFGNDGMVQTAVDQLAEDGYSSMDMEVQQDGKIVSTVPLGRGFALARYNEDGSLDAGFGTGGMVQTSIFDSNYEQAMDLVVQPNGKIVAVGKTYTPTTDFDFALVRYDADGTEDSSFGTDGIVTTNYYPLGTNRPTKLSR